MRTIIVASMTSTGREGYPTRIRTHVNELDGWVVLDQIRAIDKTRLCQKIGDLSSGEIANIKGTIKEMLVD